MAVKGKEECGGGGGGGGCKRSFLFLLPKIMVLLCNTSRISTRRKNTVNLGILKARNAFRRFG